VESRSVGVACSHAVDMQVETLEEKWGQGTNEANLFGRQASISRRNSTLERSDAVLMRGRGDEDFTTGKRENIGA
jgi:hypothetical protein